MDIVFLINRVSRHPRVVEAEFKGAIAEMTVTELEVELVDEKDGHGSLVLRFTGKPDIEAAAKFVEGSIATLSIDAFQVSAAAEPDPQLAQIETVAAEEPAVEQPAA